MIQLKNTNDLNKIRESCQLLTETYKKITMNIDIGITTKQLDSIAYKFIVKNKAIPAFLNYQGFPGTLCISINDEVIHGIPGNRKIADRDIVSFDCGLILDGYYSDSAYTFPVGNVSKEKMQLLEVTKECLSLAIKEAVPGKRIKDISGAGAGGAG